MNKKFLLNSRLFLSQKIAKIDKDIAELNRGIEKLRKEIKEQENEDWWKK